MDTQEPKQDQQGDGDSAQQHQSRAGATPRGGEHKGEGSGQCPDASWMFHPHVRSRTPARVNVSMLVLKASERSGSGP